MVIDYVVKYNINVTPLKTFASQSVFDQETCLETKTTLAAGNTQGYALSIVAASITPQITASMMNYVAGVALNGVLIMSSSSAYHDPYFPKTWT